MHRAGATERVHRRVGAPGRASPGRAYTLWVVAATGERLRADRLARLQEKAHEVYEANSHIFEDERDALAALGVLSAAELAGNDRY